MRRTVLYVLEGAWNTGSIDGCQVLGISEDREVLQDKLELVAGSRAEEYVMGHVWNGINEERGERHYEIIDDTGSWAKFYITEHYVDISEVLMMAMNPKMAVCWMYMSKRDVAILIIYKRPTEYFAPGEPLIFI